MTTCTMTKAEIVKEMGTQIDAIPMLAVGTDLFGTGFVRPDDTDARGARRLARYIKDNEARLEDAKTRLERILQKFRARGSLLFSDDLDDAYGSAPAAPPLPPIGSMPRRRF